MQDQSMEDIRIGTLLLRERVIDERQLEQALAMQTEGATYSPLGKILRELGFVSRRTLHDVLLKYRKQIPLGALLEKMGVISDDQLVQALETQERSSKRLGQILVEKGFVTRSHLVDAICTQLGISGMDHAAAVTDRKLLGQVNEAFLRGKRVIPLRYDKDDRVLMILMEDPTDRETIADFEKIFKMDVEPVMLRTGTIDHLLYDLFDVWRLSRK